MDSPHWHLVLPPVPSRSNCTVSVTNGKEEVVVEEEVEVVERVMLEEEVEVVE